MNDQVQRKQPSIPLLSVSGTNQVSISAVVHGGSQILTQRPMLHLDHREQLPSSGSDWIVTTKQLPRGCPNTEVSNTQDGKVLAVALRCQKGPLLSLVRLSAVSCSPLFSLCIPCGRSFCIKSCDSPYFPVSVRILHSLALFICFSSPHACANSQGFNPIRTHLIQFAAF